MFTASWTQAVSYLGGVCLFSISFLVFLNSSVSFVITDVLKQEDGVGDAVGTLGFADEIVALVACPLWGLASDRIGTRLVCVLGYVIVGLALFVFVQARNVYPQLLLARLFFSVGGAAVSTMVTAVLPSMVVSRVDSKPDVTAADSSTNGHPGSPSVSSELTITELRHQHRSKSPKAGVRQTPQNASPTRLAGFVGLFTGCGALLALGLFLPLPAVFRSHGANPQLAVAESFYIVGIVALVVSVICFFGLRNLEEGKPSGTDKHQEGGTSRAALLSLLLEAVGLGFTDLKLALAYLGGFVARASSVAISLFIPLYVNAYFVSSGRCNKSASSPEAVKEQCRRAYILAAELSGASQLVALIFAPMFGFLAERNPRFNIPLLVAALLGIVGYAGLTTIESPDFARDGTPAIFVIMALLGISQIGSIVCSLGLLGRCILEYRTQEVPPEPATDDGSNDPTDRATETSSLLKDVASPSRNRQHLKGSIAGVYSLAGGAGILLLTKVGGYLFDSVSPSAPFVMLSAFNGALLLFGLGCCVSEVYQGHMKIEADHSL